MFPTFISILDIQSWWEVPSIAHFCSLFRTAFNLLDFDIEDLEEALLTDGTEETSWLQELIVRLLSGCLANNEISTFNYQMFLRRLFRQKCQEHDRYNPFNTDVDFQLLPLRTKVDILHALCDFRLDADDVLDQLKNLEADSLRVEPLGYDSNESAYWYFYGTRLYREDFKTKNNKKKSVWQVICFTEEDWFQLNKKFKKSTVKCERQLYRTLTENFLPELPRLFREKERLARKRLLDGQPRRSSRRLRKAENVPEKEEVSVVESPSKDHQREECNKASSPVREEMKDRRTELGTKRREAYERRTKLKDKEEEEEEEEEEAAAEEQQSEDEEEVAEEEENRRDSESEKCESRHEKMASDKTRQQQRRQKRSKGKHHRKASRSPPNSKASKRKKVSEDASSADASVSSASSTATTTVGRQTNNSLAAATGQIVIQPLSSPHKKKLKTSQVFRQTDEDLITGMHKILDHVKNHEDAWPFEEAVEEEYAPNYYTVIRRPMDLQKMEERLDAGFYKNFSKFRDDFQLIVDNCRLYNGAENEYTEMVDNLLKAFERATEKFLDQVTSSDDEIAVEFPKSKKKSSNDNIVSEPIKETGNTKKAKSDRSTENVEPVSTKKSSSKRTKPVLAAKTDKKRRRSMSEDSIPESLLFSDKEEEEETPVKRKKEEKKSASDKEANNKKKKKKSASGKKANNKKEEKKSASEKETNDKVHTKKTNKSSKKEKTDSNKKTPSKDKKNATKPQNKQHTTNKKEKPEKAVIVKAASAKKKTDDRSRSRTRSRSRSSSTSPSGGRKQKQQQQNNRRGRYDNSTSPPPSSVASSSLDERFDFYPKKHKTSYEEGARDEDVVIPNKDKCKQNHTKQDHNKQDRLKGGSSENHEDRRRLSNHREDSPSKRHDPSEKPVLLPKPKDKHDKLRETIEKLKAKSEISNRLSDNEFMFEMDTPKENKQQKSQKKHEHKNTGGVGGGGCPDNKAHHNNKSVATGNKKHDKTSSKSASKKDCDLEDHSNTSTMESVLSENKKHKKNHHGNGANKHAPAKNNVSNNNNNNNSKSSNVALMNNTTTTTTAADNMEALTLATEQTLKDINKWLDDTPKFSEFSSASNSPSYGTPMLDEFELGPVKDKVDGNSDPVSAFTGAPGAPAPVAATGTGVRSKKTADGKVVKKDGSSGKDLKRRVFSREPGKFLKQRREIQRTIDRLQPGKSKGNLLSNVQNSKPSADDLSFPLGPLSAKSKDTKNSLIVKTDDNAPKLSLGTVLDSFGKHKFVEDEEEIAETASDKKPEENINSDAEKVVEKKEQDANLASLGVFVQPSKVSVETSEMTKTEDEKDPIVAAAATTTTESEKKTSPPAEESSASNSIANSSMMSSATPNLSAWFKAFGAPKVQTTTAQQQQPQKKLDANSKTETKDPDNKTSATEDSRKEDFVGGNNNKVPLPETSPSIMDGSIVPMIAQGGGQPVPRQRRISTGSSMSERSSFSQDMDSPRVGIDERLGGAYPAPYPSPMHRSPSGASPQQMGVMSSPRPEMSPRSGGAPYPPFNGQMRVGFYQDTVGSNKSSPDKSGCSPGGGPQSPYAIPGGGGGAVGQHPQQMLPEHVYGPQQHLHQHHHQQQQQQQQQQYGSSYPGSPYYSHAALGYPATPNPGTPYNVQENVTNQGSYFDTSKSLTDQYQQNKTMTSVNMATAQGYHHQASIMSPAGAGGSHSNSSSPASAVVPLHSPTSPMLTRDMGETSFHHQQQQQQDQISNEKLDTQQQQSAMFPVKKRAYNDASPEMLHPSDSNHGNHAGLVQQQRYEQMGHHPHHHQALLQHNNNNNNSSRGPPPEYDSNNGMNNSSTMIGSPDIGLSNSSSDEMNRQQQMQQQQQRTDENQQEQLKQQQQQQQQQYSMHHESPMSEPESLTLQTSPAPVGGQDIYSKPSTLSPVQQQHQQQHQSQQILSPGHQQPQLSPVANNNSNSNSGRTNLRNLGYVGATSPSSTPPASAPSYVNNASPYATNSNNSNNSSSNNSESNVYPLNIPSARSLAAAAATATSSATAQEQQQQQLLLQLGKLDMSKYTNMGYTGPPDTSGFSRSMPLQQYNRPDMNYATRLPPTPTNNQLQQQQHQQHQQSQLHNQQQQPLTSSINSSSSISQPSLQHNQHQSSPDIASTLRYTSNSTANHLAHLHSLGSAAYKSMDIMMSSPQQAHTNYSTAAPVATQSSVGGESGGGTSTNSANTSSINSRLSSVTSQQSSIMVANSNNNNNSAVSSAHHHHLHQGTSNIMTSSSSASSSSTSSSSTYNNNKSGSGGDVVSIPRPTYNNPGPVSHPHSRLDSLEVAQQQAQLAAGLRAANSLTNLSHHMAERYGTEEQRNMLAGLQNVASQYYGNKNLAAAAAHMFAANKNAVTTSSGGLSMFSQQNMHAAAAAAIYQQSMMQNQHNNNNGNSASSASSSSMSSSSMYNNMSGEGGNTANNNKSGATAASPAVEKKPRKRGRKSAQQLQQQQQQQQQQLQQPTNGPIISSQQPSPNSNSSSSGHHHHQQQQQQQQQGFQSYAGLKNSSNAGSGATSSSTSAMEPSAISLKSGATNSNSSSAIGGGGGGVPGSAFNFGPAAGGAPSAGLAGLGAGLYGTAHGGGSNNGSGGGAGDKDSASSSTSAYPNFLDDFRAAAPNYYMAAAAAAAAAQHHRSTPTGDPSEKTTSAAGVGRVPSAAHHHHQSGATQGPPPPSYPSFIGAPHPHHQGRPPPPSYPLSSPFMPSAAAQLMDNSPGALYQQYLLNQAGILGGHATGYPPAGYHPHHPALSMRQPPYDSMTRPPWL